MKLKRGQSRPSALLVAPRAGAWIETGEAPVAVDAALESPPVRGRGLKLLCPGAGALG